MGYKMGDRIWRIGDGRIYEMGEVWGMRRDTWRIRDKGYEIRDMK